MNWKSFLKNQSNHDYYKNLQSFLDDEYQRKTIYPPRNQLFQCFELTPYQDVKAVIVGQDPYHQPKQAHGLAFSVADGVSIPPSLRNIYKELSDDLKIAPIETGNLTGWAQEGVLLINRVMSVEKGKPNSHQNQGWEIFTDAVIKQLNNHPEPLVFILWGKNAQALRKYITNPKHLILKAPHPSPLAAYRGFFQSKPFSKTNDFLKKSGRTQINWGCLNNV